ncbi:hypothetical protein J6590_062251 [Homalodisca vitripennis]|nr:hypothetical protein J6590_062251 [Homalodisca vitripennis]
MLQDINLEAPWLSLSEAYHSGGWKNVNSELVEREYNIYGVEGAQLRVTVSRPAVTLRTKYSLSPSLSLTHGLSIRDAPVVCGCQCVSTVDRECCGTIPARDIRQCQIPLIILFGSGDCLYNSVPLASMNVEEGRGTGFIL